ncbi:hypothetical protein Poly30_34630 [Planctomycetes bacterium Poly30]|uniref:Zinc-finger domain-containing protein n=1 Tax=Saltatorellus ferox TaxID=2528018 RepID=A0A518EV11_9BACT|nr:hypothetical protein Poly30_34630 [Planctomycetes bacterium Poly30]
MTAARLRGCRAYRGPLDEIFDGLASMETRHAVEAHAETCSVCAVELRASQGVRRWIDSSPEAEPHAEAEEAFVRDVFGRIDAMESGSPPTRESIGKRSWTWRLVTAATVTAATVAAAAALLLLMRPEKRALEPSSSTDIPDAISARTEVPVAVRQAAVEQTLPDPAPVDLAALEAALRGLTADSIRPEADLRTRVGLAPITERFGFDAAQRGARAVLTNVDRVELHPVAARLLGPRADLRDRRLLLRTLSTTGLAGALALAERGPSGLVCLWDLAASDSPDDEELRLLAVRALKFRSEAGEDPLPSPLDPTRHPAVAAELIAASGEGAAARLLDLFLADGREEWMNAWLTTSERDRALAAVLRGQPTRNQPRNQPSGQRSGRAGDQTLRKLLAIEAAHHAPGLDFVIQALECGERSAAATLASLPGRAPAAALLVASCAGHLSSEIEDLAWSSLATAQPYALLDLMLESHGAVQDPAATVISSLALILEACPDARRVLVLAGLEPELTEADRTRALSLAFDADADVEWGTLLDASTRARLRELTASGEAPLAAASWMACDRLGELPPEADPDILRALARKSTGSVRHLRVTRAIEKARSRSSNRSL